MNVLFMSKKKLTATMMAVFNLCYKETVDRIESLEKLEKENSDRYYRVQGLIDYMKSEEFLESIVKRINALQLKRK